MLGFTPLLSHAHQRRGDRPAAASASLLLLLRPRPLNLDLRLPHVLTAPPLGVPACCCGGRGAPSSLSGDKPCRMASAACMEKQGEARQKR